jgi:hypothetical protein
VRPKADRQEQDSSYKARYLVIVNDQAVPRALLFGVDHRYLTEVIDDDGLVLENLVRSGIACTLPNELAHDPMLLKQHPGSASMCCFALA